MKKTQRAVLKGVSALLSLLFSGAFAAYIWFAGTFLGCYRLPVKLFAAAALILAVLLFVLKLFEGKKRAILSIGALTLVWALSLWLYTDSLKSYMSGAAYNAPHTERELFAGNKVLILVPHQDDEINILGGVMEQYSAAGSELVLAYSTNGDYETPAETRFKEAMALAEAVGIERENVHFLGYGDSWRDGHIYNAEPDEPKISHAGRSETYAVGDKEPYGGVKSCTRENFREDVKKLILSEKADIIFCIDYDSHQDHRALSLIFEEVMGEILREEDYRPLVLKAFAYSTSWFAPNDYHESYNLASTVNRYENDHMPETNIYLWSERLRLPVDGTKLARYAENSGIYRDLALFESQRTVNMAESVINSDKVMWQRETESLLYGARIETSSGDAKLLNNFMLTDSSDILSEKLPFEGTWIPEAGDGERSIAVQLPEEKDIYRICLYDHPSTTENVLNMRIDFDDGSSVETGALLKNGSATEIVVEKKSVSSFSLTILDTEGEKAGLTEIEAYSGRKQPPFRYIKLMSENDFVYDYVTAEETSELELYKAGITAELNLDNYVISCDNANIRIDCKDEKLIVNCPRGEEGTVSISHNESGESDSIRVYTLRNNEKRRLAFERYIYVKYKACLGQQIGRTGKIIDSSPVGAVTAIGKMDLLNIG